MNHRCLLLLAVAVLVTCAARANPMTCGQQLCAMPASGISQQKSWDYIVREHTKPAKANDQTIILWYSAESTGWELGNAERAQKDLAAIRPDRLRVAHTTCSSQFH